MKKFIVLLGIFFIYNCASTGTKKTGKPGNGVKSVVKTGWTDQDTYTVKVIAENRSIAVNKAQHQILKDIVNVRVRYGSRYTDITKIQQEFEKPLEKEKRW